MKNGIFFSRFRNQKRKSYIIKRVHFQNRRYKHIFKSLKRRRYKFFGKRKLFVNKNRIKKAIKETNDCAKNNDEKIVDKSAIDSIIEKMSVMQL